MVSEEPGRSKGAKSAQNWFQNILRQRLLCTSRTYWYILAHSRTFWHLVIYDQVPVPQFLELYRAILHLLTLVLNRGTSWYSNQGRYRQKQMCSLIFKTKSFYIPSICFYLFLPVSNKNSRKCNDWCFLFCLCIKLYSVTLTLLHIVWTILSKPQPNLNTTVGLTTKMTLPTPPPTTPHPPHKLFRHFQTSQRAEIWHRHSLDQSD